LTRFSDSSVNDHDFIISRFLNTDSNNLLTVTKMKKKQNNNSVEFELIKTKVKNLRELYHAFASDFARTILTLDFISAHQYLAPWLQKEISADDLQAKFEARLWEMNEIWGIEQLIYPADFSVDFNPCNLMDLKKIYDWRESRNFSDELTDENFRQWMVIQFMPDENDERIELDAWFDFWFVVAEVTNELKIGFFEFEDPD